MVIFKDLFEYLHNFYIRKQDEVCFDSVFGADCCVYWLYNTNG